MKNLWIIPIIAVAVILTACSTEIIMPPQGDQPNTLTVQGESQFEVAPDLAKIQFAIETRSTTAQDAQLRNRQVQDEIKQALNRVGVSSSDVETTNYNVQRWYEWDYKENKQIDKGYIVSNNFVVKTTDLQKVGDILDAGVQAGANRVDSISFELSDEKSRQVKQEALRNAATNARDKAVALAEGSGVRLGAVKSISENSYVVMPYARGGYDAVMMKAEGAPVPSTEISPQNVQVNAQVSVGYIIG
jgi:uncharacterized protein YggE